MKEKMKNATVRGLSLILALACLGGLFCACADKNGEENSTTVSQNTAATTAPETTEKLYDKDGFLLDQLPEELDWHNIDVTMLTWADVEHEEFFVDTLIGDVVNDAIFERTAAVEERLGIHFKEITCKANASNINTWATFVNNDHMAGNHSFDVMAAYSQSMANVAAMGLCYDLLSAECSYLNFENPWWSKHLVSQATINGKLAFCSGDISINALYMMYTCFVNMGILVNNHLDSPTDLVIPGKWTIDRFFELCSGIYIDLNGNGKKDQGDQFGHYTYDLNTDPFFYGIGAVMVEKNADGHLIISESLTSEKVVDTLERLNNLIWNSDDGFLSKTGYVNEFRDGRVLFCTTRARNAFKDFASNAVLNYSVLPCPKYNEDQAEYYSVLGVPFTLYALPADVRDPAMGSAVLECLASESYRRTTPAAFEITLKTKYAKNETAAIMYDIIRNGLTYDVGRLYGSALIGVTDWRHAVNENLNNWTSTMKGKRAILEKKLAELESVFAD